MTRPSRPVKTTTPMTAAHSGQCSRAISHQPTSAPTAKTAPWAKLMRLETPKISEMPTASSAYAPPLMTPEMRMESIALLAA